MKALILVVMSAALGQTVELPAEVKGQPGMPIPIIAKGDLGANVTWLTPDKGLAVVDGGFFGGDSRKAMLFGPQGNYRLWAITAKGDKVSALAECRVIIGTPGPDPGPTPPGPDPGPEPTDTLWVPLKSAWAAEPDATRKADRDALARLYEEGASYARAGKFAKLVELNQVLTDARKSLMGDRLPKLREVLNAESARVLGTMTDTTVDAGIVNGTFTRYVLLLRRLP